MMSVVLPAPTGTIARNGFVGQASARASMVASPSPSTGSNVKYIDFMSSSLLTDRDAVPSGAEFTRAAVTQYGVAVQYLIPLAI
jgi:hypothetical protein